MEDSHQIVLFHYQTVTEKGLSSEGERGHVIGCDSLPINYHIYDCAAAGGSRASDCKVTK